MTAREFFLYESQLMRGGSRYTKIARFGLKQISCGRERPAREGIVCAITRPEYTGGRTSGTPAPTFDKQ